MHGIEVSHLIESVNNNKQQTLDFGLNTLLPKYLHHQLNIISCGTINCIRIESSFLSDDTFKSYKKDEWFGIFNKTYCT